ncbi:MAG TPA: hypothetical protein VII49_11175, partial [Rhizomicrobium sp.]
HINSSCHDVRLIGDLVSGAGKSGSGSGIVFAGGEGTISGGVIQESAGIGLDLAGADRVSVTAEHIQGNGRGASGGAGIRINNSNTIAISGNHLEGNGGFETGSAQILFAGTSDNINIGTNVYAPETISNVALGPSFVYDAAPGTVLTNPHLYDSPSPQAGGAVYSPAAAAILPQLQAPHVPLSQIAGLTLSNDLTTTTQVDFAPGEATDSTGTATIALASSCPVNLAALTNGPGGLDTGSAVANTTYFYFVIASVGGGNPSCMASTNTAPSFKYSGAPYDTSVSGLTYMGFPYIYNMASVAGLAVGQRVEMNSYISPATTIAAIGTLTSEAVATIATTCSMTCATTVTVPSGSAANMAVGMEISDVFQSAANCTGGNLARGDLPANTYTISSAPAGGVFSIMPAVGTSNATIYNDCIVVSSGYTVQLAAPASGTTTMGVASFTVYTGIYRMAGALYTNPSNTNVVPFMQDGDTFTLQSPVADLNTNNTGGNACNSGTIGNADVSCALSVPCGLTIACSSGIKVEALGRIVGGTLTSLAKPTLISSIDSNPGAPTAFPGAPGYSTSSAGSATTAYPFRLYTNTSGQVRLRASSSGASVYEDTDGWVFQRGQ